MRKLLFLLFTLLSVQFVAARSGDTNTQGRFKASDESLSQYKCPEWFQDAKFGIWAHWGPQAVPRMGDWYAKNMYEEGKWVYNEHVKRYGHPSKFGFKDIIPLWKAERFDPEALMKLYKRVGAKYFVSMGVHCDNFFLWDTEYTKWKSTNMGPKRDIVADWKAAAKKEGLYFGVSEHLAPSYVWYQSAKTADKNGPMAGVPYDANDPQYVDLYHEKAAPDDTIYMTKNPEWQQDWYNYSTELIDKYSPDLIYADCPFPFGHVGRSLISYYYNSNMDKNNNTNVVYNCKERTGLSRFVYDLELGVTEDIAESYWQTCTSIGDWFYRTGQPYKTAPQIIQMLVDIVSKNGNLLLNVVQTPEGDLEPDVIEILEGIAQWIEVNGEAIYGTRPWTVYGEGPSTVKKQAKGQFGGLKDVRAYESTDIRFTKKGNVLYAFCMEQPKGDIQINSLSDKNQISSIKMLGSKEKISWDVASNGLNIAKPANMPDYSTIVFEITLKN